MSQKRKDETKISLEELLSSFPTKGKSFSVGFSLYEVENNAVEELEGRIEKITGRDKYLKSTACRLLVRLGLAALAGLEAGSLPLEPFGLPKKR